MKTSGLAVLATLLMLGLAACQTETVRKGGFQGSFQTTYTSSPGRLIWIDAEAREVLYERIMVDPVQIRLGNTTGVDARMQPVIARRFEEALARALEPDYPLVRATDEGVLRVRAFVTDRLEVPQLMPRAGTLGIDPGGAMPRVGLEVRFYDGGSDHLVAAVINLQYSPNLTAALRGHADALAGAFVPFARNLRLTLDGAAATR